MAELMCKSCQKKVQVSDIRADKSGSGWVCVNCYKTQHPKIYGVLNKKEISKALPQKIQRAKYYCGDCGYKFTKEINYKGRCPYCNKLTVKLERDAESLIKESVQDESMGFNKSRLKILEDL